MRVFWIAATAAVLLAGSLQPGLAKPDKYRSNNEDVMSEFSCTGMTSLTGRCPAMANKRFKREHGDRTFVNRQRNCQIVFYPFIGAVTTC